MPWARAEAEAAARLSSRDVVSVREACSASLVYEDQPRGIAVYVLDFKGHRAVCDPKGTYELVLILDPSNGVERYRLLRVK